MSNKTPHSEIEEILNNNRKETLFDSEEANEIADDAINNFIIVVLPELANHFHHQLQKAKEGMLHTLDSCIDNVTYAPKKPSDYKAWQDGFMEAYQQARKIIKHSKLDKPTV